MSIKKSGGVSRFMAIMIASALATIITIPTFGISNKLATIYKEHIESYNRDKVIREEYRKTRESEDSTYKGMATELSNKIKEERAEAERMKNYTYRKTKELRATSGLNVVGFEEYTFELSFYSDLNCENGYGNLTANGERLSSGMIANNFLPFNTRVYLEGHGTKRVTDRGSHKYFNAVNKEDVFVPKNGGESVDAYYRRVNSMGRIHVKGYILKLGENK